MAINPTTDLQVFRSAARHGGAISGVIANGFNFFLPITGAQTSAGVTQYYCGYVRNLSTTNTAKDVRLRLKSYDSHAGVTLAFGNGKSAINVAEQETTNINTAPLDVTFSGVTGEAGQLALGNLQVSEYKSFWIRAQIDAATAAKNDLKLTLSVVCDTDE